MRPAAARSMMPRMAVLTDEQKEKVLELIRSGVRAPTAARMMGLSLNELNNTGIADHDFRAELARADAEAQARLEASRYAAGLEDPKIAGEELATRDPLQHSPRVQSAIALAQAQQAAAKDAGLPQEIIRELHAVIDAKRRSIEAKGLPLEDKEKAASG